MKPKDKLIKTINYEIEKLHEMLYQIENIPLNLIVEMFPQGRWQKNWSDVNFVLPLSFELIDSFKEMMTFQFPEFELKRENQYVWSDGNGSAGRFLTYSKPDPNSRYKNIDFDVSFRSEEEGSTCILNPIGKKMKEVTEYEVVCSQQAVEEFGIGEF